MIFRNEDDEKPPSERRWHLFNVAMPLIPADLPIHQIRSPEEEEKGNIVWNSQNNLNHAESVDCIGLSETTIPSIPKVKELYLYRCEQLRDVSNLSHLEQLDILISSQLEDLTPLSSIPKVRFYSLREASDFSMFNCNKQSYLRISDCQKISSLESFRMIKKLVLSNCPKITDVSCLYGIYDLTLHVLPNVKDISGLGGHHRIYLHLAGENVTGYECLYNIPYVYLVANLTDISMLRNAKSVKLSGFNDLKDVSPLAKVKEVNFYHCYSRDIDISSLRTVPTLRIHQAHNLYSSEKMQNQFVDIFTDFGGFGRNVRTVFRSFSHVQNLSLTLRLSSEEQLRASEYVLSFQNLQSLTLERFKGEIDKYEALGDIPRVTLVSLETKNIKCLGRKNRYVELNMCYNVEDVSSLKNVPVVTIIRCPGIKNMEVLGDVPRLKVSNQLKR